MIKPSILALTLLALLPAACDSSVTIAADTNAPAPSRVKTASPPAALDAPATNPMPRGPIPLQSASVAPRPPVITAEAAFAEGVRIGAILGRRNPDMTDPMLRAAAAEVWQRQFGAAVGGTRP